MSYKLLEGAWGQGGGCLVNVDLTIKHEDSDSGYFYARVTDCPSSPCAQCCILLPGLHGVPPPFSPPLPMSSQVCFCKPWRERDGCEQGEKPGG